MTNGKQEEQVKVKSCVACGSSIPSNATLCHDCKSYQQPWKARAQFFSSITAFTVASVSLAAWTISLLPQVRAVVFPRDDLRVIACNTLHGGVVANQGDREAFVSHVLLFMTGRQTWTAQRFPVNETVTPDKFLRIPVPGADGLGKGLWVRGVPTTEWNDFVARALDDQACFRIVLFATADPLLRELTAAAGPSLNRLEADGYLEYRSIRGSEYRQLGVPAVGAILARGSSECTAKIPGRAPL